MYGGCNLLGTLCTLVILRLGEEHSHTDRASDPEQRCLIQRHYGKWIHSDRGIIRDFKTETPSKVQVSISLSWRPSRLLRRVRGVGSFMKQSLVCDALSQLLA